MELALLVEVGRRIGTWYTVLLVIGTGALGALLAQTQGWSIWRRTRREIRSGRIPGDELLDALLVLIGAVLLLTPGLITDAVGLSLLIPLTRGMVRKFIKRRIAEYVRIDPSWARWGC